MSLLVGLLFDKGPSEKKRKNASRPTDGICSLLQEFYGLYAL